MWSGSTGRPARYQRNNCSASRGSSDSCSPGKLIPRLGIIDPAYLPPASEVIAALVVDFGLTAFWVAVYETMKAWFLGLLMAVAAAVVLGFIIGSSNFLRKATNSTIEFLRPIPSVALIPLAVLMFGVKIESSLLLIVYACFWQVLIQVLYGVADVDMVANNTAEDVRPGQDGPDPLRRLSHRPALPDDRCAARRVGGAGPGHHG